MGIIDGFLAKFTRSAINQYLKNEETFKDKIKYYTDDKDCMRIYFDKSDKADQRVQFFDKSHDGIYMVDLRLKNGIYSKELTQVCERCDVKKLKKMLNRYNR